MQNNLKILEKLKKLFDLNKKNPKKVNDNLIKLIANCEMISVIFKILKINKNAMTHKVLSQTSVKFDIENTKKLSNNIKNSIYKRRGNRKDEIFKLEKKELKSISISNFYNNVIWECINIILNCIYEPLFQKTDCNHYFSYKRNSLTSILKIRRESPEMQYVLEGILESAYLMINYKTLFTILRKKIKDQKFLKLIKDGLIFNLFKLSRKGLVSTIFFNVYVHEFDIEVFRVIKEYKKKLDKSKTNTRRYNSLWYNQTQNLKSRQHSIKQMFSNKKLTKVEKKKLYIKYMTGLRKTKKKMINVSLINKNDLTLRFVYIRYARNWLLLTNASLGVVQDLREYITKWLKKKVALTVNSKKIWITSLEKDKIMFLGFILYRSKKRLPNSDKSNPTVSFTVCINHLRVQKKLVTDKVLLITSNKLIPRSNPFYSILKPWEIVIKYRQRIEILINYYYTVLTFLSELHLYHYIYKFSCLKTIAKKMKKSITSVTKAFGPTIEIPYEIKIKDKEDNVVKLRKKSKFPKYLDLIKTF